MTLLLLSIEAGNCETGVISLSVSSGPKPDVLRAPSYGKQSPSERIENTSSYALNTESYSLNYKLLKEEAAINLALMVTICMGLLWS